MNSVVQSLVHKLLLATLGQVHYQLPSKWWAGSRTNGNSLENNESNIRIEVKLIHVNNDNGAFSRLVNAVKDLAPAQFPLLPLRTIFKGFPSKESSTSGFMTRTGS